MVKKGIYYGNEGLSLAGDLGVILLGMQDLRFWGLKKFCKIAPYITTLVTVSETNLGTKMEAT